MIFHPWPISQGWYEVHHLTLSDGHQVKAWSNNRSRAQVEGFEFSESKYATDLWHVEYGLQRDPKWVRLTWPSAWRQQNNIKPAADGWMLPRGPFWTPAGPHNLRQPWSLRDIRQDGCTLTGRLSVVCVIERSVSHKVSFFCRLLTGLQSDWIIEGAAGPAEGHDRHDALSSWRFTFSWLTDTTRTAPAAFVCKDIVSFNDFD